MNYLLKKLIYLAILLIATVIGFLKWNKLSKEYRYLSVLFLITFIFETLAVVFAYTVKNNTIVYEIFDPLQLILFSCIFYEIIISRSTKRKVLISAIIMSLIIILSSVLDLEAGFLNSYSVVIKSIYYIFLSLIVFRQVLLNPRYSNILKEPVFWFCAALLFFFTINILFWTSNNYLINHDKTSLPALYLVLYFSNLIFYLVLLYAVILVQKQDNKP